MLPTWKSILKRFKSPSTPTRPITRRNRTTLRAESLEDRTVPAFLLRASADGGLTFLTAQDNVASGGPATVSDLSPTPGSITAFFTFNSISFMVSAAQSKPQFGNSPSNAIINLNTSGTFATDGTIIIDVTDTDFQAPGNPTGPGTLTARLSTNNVGLITDNQVTGYANGGTPGGNAAFGGIPGIPTTGNVFTTPTAATSAQHTPVAITTSTTIPNLLDPYSLSSRLKFTGTAGAGFSIVNDVVFTPTPVAPQPEVRIKITPDATNEVGQPHTFIATVEQDDGLAIGAPGGDTYNGYGPAANAMTTINLANLNGASASPLSFNGFTNAAGQFEVTTNSSTAGQIVANATASVIVGGLTLVRDTDPATANIGAGPGGSGPATKTYVDANITITPDATNEVGQPHTFTITVRENAGNGAGFVPAAGETVTVTLTNTNGASAPTTTFTGTTDANGQFQVTFASSTAGQVIGNATASVVVGGLTLVRDTDPATTNIGAGPGGSGEAVKKFVDAKIIITPNATNEVGDPHTFTVTVLENAGDGLGFVPASGESVTVNLANLLGASAPVTTFTGTTNAAGQFEVTTNSSTAGQIVANATASVVVGGLTLVRDTDPATVTIGAGPGGSGPATKTYVDAKVTITPDATNAVGDPHTFVVTVFENAGNGAGFVPAAGESVTVTLTNTNGASAPTTTFTGTTNAAGQFQVTFASGTAGQVIGNATASVVVGGLSLTRDTDPATAAIGAGPGGSGPATKTYVDAKITITPNATNEVGDPHTFTVTVQENAGNGAGFVAAAGENVTVTLTNVNGASVTPLTYTGTTNAAGQFVVTINSPTAGQVIANASSTILVDGLSLVRDTDPATATIGAGPGGSGPATKTYVDARVTITPDATNAVGDPHTFTITVLENAGGGLGFVPAAGETVTVTLTNTNGASAPTTTFTGTTNAAGQFQVTFASSTAGLVIGNATATVSVGGLSLVRDTNPATANIGAGPGGSGPATKRFVDAKIILTPPTAINPVNDPHVITATVLQDDGLTAAQGGDGVTGFAPAPNGTVVNFSLQNSGGASASFVGGSSAVVSGGTASVTINSATAGLVTINGTTTFAVGGVNLTRDTDPATGSISAGPGGSGPALKTYVTPGIDLEKTTNGPTNSNQTAPDYDNEDAPNGTGVPILTPGTAVTWTYKVTNTGGLPYQFNEIVIVDDNGTPSNAADDLSTTNGQITFLSVQTGDADNILEPGEVWLYKASGVVQALPGSSGSGTSVTFDFGGNSSLDGPDGNIREYDVDDLSVKAKAYSRDRSTGAWSKAWLGSYGGGLGVTDSSEGSGGSNSHTVDNSGRDNGIFFAFNQTVAVDAAFLGYVVGDSDLRVWIGNLPDAFDDFDTFDLSDAVLLSLGFTELNSTSSSSSRWADFNGGGITGNVLVIAADPEGTNDMFKVELLKVKKPTTGIYANKATVTVPGDDDSDKSHYKNPTANPGIDLEKTTNGPTNSNPTAPDYDNEDAPTGAGVPVLTPGSSVTWTYKVTNTGTVPFTAGQITLVDDNGTPNDSSDDFSIANGRITFLSVESGDADNILEPGEVWLYKATGTVQTLSTTTGSAVTFNFAGNSSLDGTDGNVRTFTAGDVNVKVAAYSRDKSTGQWADAWLGSYGGGLGVTDSGEGSGGGNSHTVDNIGRDNYVMFAFDQTVVVDSAFLGYVVGDSDLRIWIGNMPSAYANLAGVLLSDAMLASLGFTEVNLTDLTGSRLADFNSGGIAGNVIVIAADPGDSSPDDQFKIEKMTIKKTTTGVYENKATVTVPGDNDSDKSHYKNPVSPPPPPATPKIDIEKTTNGSSNSNSTAPTYDNEDTAIGAGVPVLTPGSDVTWTYKVTNTGNVPFAASQIAIVDDAGTSGSTGDDMSIANGKITFLSVQTGDADNILEPGEVWLYKATGTVKELTAMTGSTVQFDFSGSSSLNGTDGNNRSFSAGGINVKAAAFSRDKSTGEWADAWLGSYGGGLGVTDSGEGDGSGNGHTVDNSGRDNYVMFAFDQQVVVDAAYLGYVVGDSDIRVWIGNIPDGYANFSTLDLSDAVLASLGFTEVNLTDLDTARWADFNSGNRAGNVLVIASDPGDTTPDDRFKIELLKVKAVVEGVYSNRGTVTVPGASDSDLSHYVNPVPCLNGGARTIGYWGNSNGESQIYDGGSSSPELSLLRNYYLRKADGTNFDPTTYAQLDAWLQAASGTNMAYMLSAQLAAMVLNVEAGFVSNTDKVKALDLLAYEQSCGINITQLNSSGVISIQDLISLANAALQADGTTEVGDNDRAYQTALKNALDLANNNMNFVTV